MTVCGARPAREAMGPSLNLAWPFSRSASRFPDRLCVSAGGQEHTYGEALTTVRRIAEWLSESGQLTPSRVGILASRSWEACAGILGTAWSGAAYVALNLSQPPEALIALLDRLNLDALIADSTGLQKLTAELVPHLPPKVLVPGQEALAANSQWRTFGDLPEACRFEPRPVRADSPAYIEFTSGSTGIPKGVAIPNGAVSHFIRIMQRRYDLQAEDRIAETADTSFDISVFDMFMTWNAGASLHAIPRSQAIAPARYIQEHGITVWFSVPSVAAAMGRMGMLAAGAFPTLRVSLFSGEPLPAKVALAWKEAAPNSVVDNVYGPTEATVVCLHERVGEIPNVTKERDVIAIGRPLEGSAAAVWDSSRRTVPTGVTGELVLAGPQLALGYLDDPEKTAARFVEQNGTRWYLTGDLAYQDGRGLFHHLGRIDNQVKIRGHRVELEDIESHLRQVYRTPSVAAVAWPMQFGTAAGIVAFVSGPGRSDREANDELRRRMPPYMVPDRVHVLAALPVNSSGKVDRKILAKKLDEEEF
ncbi:MAG: amino acid adenylation domain-containing protein [Candidatus Sulfotelmatobacter sp.]